MRARRGAGFRAEDGKDRSGGNCRREAWRKRISRHAFPATQLSDRRRGRTPGALAFARSGLPRALDPAQNIRAGFSRWTEFFPSESNARIGMRSIFPRSVRTSGSAKVGIESPRARSHRMDMTAAQFDDPRTRAGSAPNMNGEMTHHA